MPTKPKSTKKAKRVNWREEYQAVVDLFVALSDVHNDTLKNRQTLQLSHDEWLRRAEAAERHNAELLREVEELHRNAKANEADRKFWREQAKRTFGARLRALLRSFRRERVVG